MTDNRTNELREKLDELGIEHFDYDKGGRTQTQWEAPDGKRHFTYETSDNPAKTARLVIAWHPTPEQAIAATLGNDDDYERKMDTLLCRLTNGKWSKSRAYSIEFMDACISEEFEALYSEEQFSAPVHGTLTAEQVRETVEKHWHDLPDEYDMPEATALPEYSYNWQAIADELNAELGSEINGDTSDGYHTFNELYHHRAVLFSVIVRDHRELAWKARKHHDGTMYDGMFIVGIETPKGQATYHYDLDPYWEMFDCEEREYAPEWDGHTPDDAIARIAELGSGTCRLHYGEDDDGYDGWYCDECGGWFQAVRRDGHLVEPKHCQECGKAVKR